MLLSKSTEPRSQDLNVPEGSSGWVRHFIPARQIKHFFLHTHRELELNLVTEGFGEYLIQGARYPIATGTLLWLFPTQSHLLLRASRDMKLWVAVFADSVTQDHLREHSRTGPGSHPESGLGLHSLSKPLQNHLEMILQWLADQNSRNSSEVNAGLQFILKYAWSIASEAESLNPISHVHPAVEKVAHRMSSGKLQESLIKAASRSGMSYSRLSHLFKKEMGETMGAFRERLRVESFRKAVCLHPDKSLLEIALDSGFGSYPQCHRSVKRITGHSPAALRRELTHFEESEERHPGML